MARGRVKTTMSKLEHIRKKHIFEVPEDYFDKLPLKIQSRIEPMRAEPLGGSVFRYTMQYALPLMLIAAILFFYIRPGHDAASILATVETKDLINYLLDSGLTTEDLLENVHLNSVDLEAIENEVYDLELPAFYEEEMDAELNAL